MVIHVVATSHFLEKYGTTLLHCSVLKFLSHVVDVSGIFIGCFVDFFVGVYVGLFVVFSGFCLLGSFNLLRVAI